MLFGQWHLLYGFAEDALSQGKGILFGMSTALKGPAADMGQNMRKDVLGGFERVNRAGGIHGVTLKLLALDDEYEPVRIAPNM